MRQRGVLRVLAVLAAALLFGVVASLAKGTGGGLRDGLGNLSAPWVIVPLLAGAAASRGRVTRGAGAGLGATLLALTGFYLVSSSVLSLGSHLTLADVGLTLNVGSLWFKAGLVSGPVMGALGAWASRHGWFRVALIATAIVLLEPLVLYLYLHLRPGGGGSAGWQLAYALEAIAGVGAGLALWGMRPRRHTL